MISAGIDIGSRTIKLAVVENNSLLFTRKIENSFDTLNACKGLLKDISYDQITSTGYGRHFFAEHFTCNTISEIKAFALGANYTLPSCRTILDIGGQDTKAILLDEHGKLKKFEMNDKCAAGTGKFLEIMAMALRYTLNEFGEVALKAEESININSMCTVFAESEVVSMLARGIDRVKVAKGIHQSVATRSLSLLRRVGIEKEVVFAGGVALNKGIVHLLEQQLQMKIFVPNDPQIIGALGAALNNSKKE